MLVDPKEFVLREAILRRVMDPDEEMQRALERLRKNFYGPYMAIRAYWEDPERLEAWRAAQKPSQEWRMGLYFDQALRLLGTALYG